MHENSVQAHPDEPLDRDFRRRHRLSWLLDNSIRLPGGFRIGLDGIIGLVPGFGDMLGGLLSSLILYQAHRRNIPKMVLARMLINVLIDVGIGAIPIIGDLFDFWWKANLRIGNINRYSIVVEPEMLARYGAYFSAKDPSKP